MKTLYYLLAVLLSFAVSCGKSDNSADKPGDGESETIQFGYTIGDMATDIYAEIQEKGITDLHIVGNTFYDLEEIDNKIPLYNDLLLVNSQERSQGVQLYFSDDTVRSIYLNNQSFRLAQWPEETGAPAYISSGDDVDMIYDKLELLKSDENYADYMEEFDLFNKDASKVYDPVISESSQWFYTHYFQNDTVKALHLYFSEGKLDSVTENIHQTIGIN